MAKKKTPPKEKTALTEESSLLRWLKDRRITEVECLVPDMTGIARGKIIPAAKFSHDYGTRLPEGIFVTTVTGDDGEPTPQRANLNDSLTPDELDRIATVNRGGREFEYLNCRQKRRHHL